MTLEQSSLEEFSEALTHDLRPFAIRGGRIGRGASAAVYHCADARSGVEVACKLISKAKGPPGSTAPPMEAALMNALQDHPGVVRLQAFHEGRENYVLTMEWCRGGDLLDRINSHGVYSEREAAAVCMRLASVLQACHSRHIMHRDVKPENVLLVSKDSPADVRLADFGHATFFMKGVNFSETVGTTLYASPEVLNGSYGPESDLWSLGVLLYILLSGRQPFRGPTLDGTLGNIAAGRFDVENGPWARITDPAIHLVKRLLTVDPETRITPEQVLSHPWILRHCQGNDLRSMASIAARRNTMTAFLHAPHSSAGSWGALGAGPRALLIDAFSHVGAGEGPSPPLVLASGEARQAPPAGGGRGPSSAACPGRAGPTQAEHRGGSLRELAPF